MSNLPNHKLPRREFLTGLAAASGIIATPGVGRMARAAHGARDKRVIVLGIDGMDARLLRKFMDAGQMPNFRRLAAQGGFSPLATTMPPQSPVAWSTFITGMDPGGHGIFDFLHRDTDSPIAPGRPYSSMSSVEEGKRKVEVGSWVIPLSKGGAKQLRKGRAFWQVLDDHGVSSVIYRIPANFPPVETDGKSLSGMGTPDLLGTIGGQFSYYTTQLPPNHREFTGGEAFKVEVKNGRVDTEIHGPPNTFRREATKASIRAKRRNPKTPLEYETPECVVPFSVFLDPEEALALIDVQGDRFILKEGEWSDWVSIEFKVVPGLVGIRAKGRFLLKQVHPELQLYLSPLQIDPTEPALPISTPGDWSRKLAAQLGPFYTQGLPADTKALTYGVFTPKEFWDQTQFLLEERLRTLDLLLGDFRKGLLFFYFSTIDESSHMLWRYMDPDHPGYDPSAGLGDGLQKLYRRMDDMLGEVTERVDDDTSIIVMSDHGFSPFYWGVNLNTWLLETGYVTLKDPARQGEQDFWKNVDWSRTEAYALGLNGLYVNLKGRERQGIVAPGAEYKALLDRLEAGLLAMRNPGNKLSPVSAVARPSRDFHGPYAATGPDLIVGYHWGYRASWETPLGKFPREVFVDNLDAWSADHCMDPRMVPGILVSNHPITMDSPGLADVTIAVLAAFGVDPLPEMPGRNCLDTETIKRS